MKSQSSRFKLFFETINSILIINQNKGFILTVEIMQFICILKVVIACSIHIYPHCITKTTSVVYIVALTVSNLILRL